ncbi:MAG: hypothetical protein ASARMPREDX12_008450 [Alectoria sarmentosa]|nr:MAG: hypothetical protein ASARMPREDX12_008450 [Alectoria sarmentosa]
MSPPKAPSLAAFRARSQSHGVDDDLVWSVNIFDAGAARVLLQLRHGVQNKIGKDYKRFGFEDAGDKSSNKDVEEVVGGLRLLERHYSNGNSSSPSNNRPYYLVVADTGTLIDGDYINLDFEPNDEGLNVLVFGSTELVPGGDSIYYLFPDGTFQNDNTGITNGFSEIKGLELLLGWVEIEGEERTMHPRTKETYNSPLGHIDSFAEEFTTFVANRSGQGTTQMTDGATSQKLSIYRSLEQ